ncbi:MAG TPA: PQQ-binding-like beta-propeller repeat protein, partial [Acidimicrobiales bacterium]|nr:PQQ-binding-like beta-propeller repeat protein [Acidimicrobiales bacterium]
MRGTKRRSKLLIAAAAGLLGGVVPGAVGVPTNAALPAAPAQTGCAGPPAWPMGGADLANTRDAPGGPSASQVGSLTVLWRFHAADGDFTGTPVVGGCTVYVGSNGGWVRALHEKDGSLSWKTQVGGPIPSSAALDGTTVFVAIANPGAPSVAALDASTGKVLWETKIDAQPDSDAYGSPIVYQGVVYEGVG